MKHPFDPAAKLCRHTDRLKDWIERKQIAPLLVEIDPVNYCDARCPWCYYGNRSNRPYSKDSGMANKWGGKNIDSEAMFRAIPDMAHAGVKAINWTGGGEPTLHPDIKAFTQLANENGIAQGLFTNALSEKRGVDPQLFEWIRISLTEHYLDGISKPLLERYLAVTKVGITMNINSTNQRYVEEMCLGARGLGVAYFQVRPAIRRDYSDQEDIEPPIELKQYETDQFAVYLSPYKFSDYRSPKSYTLCRAGQFTPVLDCWGNLRGCNYHLNEPSYAIGNIGNESFSAIAARMPRETAVSDSCQTCCKNNEINKFLDRLESVEDVNFI